MARERAVEPGSAGGHGADCRGSVRSSAPSFRKMPATPWRMQAPGFGVADPGGHHQHAAFEADLPRGGQELRGALRCPGRGPAAPGRKCCCESIVKASRMLPQCSTSQMGSVASDSRHALAEERVVVDQQGADRLVVRSLSGSSFHRRSPPARVPLQSNCPDLAARSAVRRRGRAGSRARYTGRVRRSARPAETAGTALRDGPRPDRYRGTAPPPGRFPPPRRCALRAAQPSSACWLLRARLTNTCSRL